MAIKREEKEQIVDELAKILKDSKGLVFADYQGLSVNQIQELRSKLREENSSLKVAKLTLMTKAAKAAGLEIDLNTQTPTAVAYSLEDEVVPAKVLVNFSKENESLEVLFGVLENNLLDNSQVKDLASLPSKQQLQGQLVGVMAGPMRGLAGVLSGVQRSLVYTLQAIAQK